MLAPVAAALAIAIVSQSSSGDRVRAEQLARAGQTVAALELYQRIVADNPRDVEARLWIARLHLRLGRTEEAEAGFRDVLRDHPADVDARIGLGSTLIRRGAWQEALTILQDTEREAGENADLFAALARAYRRAGDDGRALEYFRRARALSPGDPDVVSGYEATARAYGHSIAAEGFGERVSPGTNAGSGSILVGLRATPPLLVEGSARVQRRSGATDVIGGGGIDWRARRDTTVDAHILAGPGNVSLATADAGGGFVHYTGVFEAGAALRVLKFRDTDVYTLSPVFAWDPGGRWRLDTRYTYSRSSFRATGQSSNDQSAMLRETWRGWRRVSLIGTYAYGIESFEDLTADRLGSLGSTTAAAGTMIDMPSLTRLTLTWEHQWRSNKTAMDRVTLSMVQFFP